MPSEQFDLTFARFLLVHLDHPVNALRRMWRWTAPRGRMAALEFDLRTLSGQGIDSINHLADLLAEVLGRAGRDLRFGSRLPDYFRRATGGTPDGVSVSGLLLPLHELAPFLEATFRSLIPAARRLGVEIEQRSELFRAALAQESRGECRYVLGPLMVSAWKQKPPA